MEKPLLEVILFESKNLCTVKPHYNGFQGSNEFHLLFISEYLLMKIWEIKKKISIHYRRIFVTIGYERAGFNCSLVRL